MATVRSGTATAQCEGLTWALDPGSCIGRSLLDHGTWEPATTRLLLALVQPGMTVLDVGANFGWFTLLLARKVGARGRVIAFEPVAAYRRALHVNLVQNSLQDRVTVVPWGLSDRAAARPIAVGASSATLHWSGGEVACRREVIELRVLDEVLALLDVQRIDLIKVDLDGHEPRFLRGAAGALRRWRPLLSLEFAQHCLHQDGSDVREQLGVLHALDYEVCRESDGLPFESDVHFLVECGNFDRSANALAVPAERLAGMPLRLHCDLDSLRAALGLPHPGAILEDDIDVPTNDCELFGRKRRDAEVLTTLSANADGPCLDLGTSFGRSAFKLATNLGGGHCVHTVNMLPEHADGAGAQITHVLARDQIGSYFRERGVANVVQHFANTKGWQPPAEVDDLALAFVDACHDADAVRRDSHLCWSRLRPGGFLVWHDFSPTQRQRHGWIADSMRGAAAFLADVGHSGPVHHLRGSWCGVLQKERA